MYVQKDHLCKILILEKIHINNIVAKFLPFNTQPITIVQYGLQYVTTTNYF